MQRPSPDPASNPASEDRWYLVARFITKLNRDDVFFVKTREHSRGQDLCCNCDGFAANSINGKSECRHTRYCKRNVLDFEGGILIDKMPPKDVARNGKLMNLWVDRHVRTFQID